MPESEPSIGLLLKACAENGSALEWERFIERTQPMLACAVVQTARIWGQTSPQAAEDLLQDVYFKIYSRRSQIWDSFKSDQPDTIFGYLKQLARNTVHDHMKAERSGKRGAALTDSLEEHSYSIGTNDLGSLDRGILISQIDSVLARNLEGPHASRNRTIFWLYYRNGMTAAAIGALPALGMDVKAVETVINRLVRLVREALAQRQPMKLEKSGRVSA